MKKFNWEEFKDKDNNIAVHCKTREEAEDFCKKMHEHGMKWISGRTYIQSMTHYNVYKEKTCYANDGMYSSYDFFKEEKYQILEWSNYMKKEFTKSDLKNGMVIEYANGKRRLVLNDFLTGKDGYYYLRYYKENLKDKSDPDRDIVRVFKINTATTLDYIFHTDQLELIWERKETKHMTSEEMRQKLEELTGEKIEMEPNIEEKFGVVSAFCKRGNCDNCCLALSNDDCMFDGDFEKTENIKECYEKVMEDGRKES